MASLCDFFVFLQATLFTFSSVVHGFCRVSFVADVTQLKNHVPLAFLSYASAMCTSYVAVAANLQCNGAMIDKAVMPGL